MRRFTPIGSSWTSIPQTDTRPDVGGMKPVIMRMVVDLPAPLGPRNPSTSPLPTSNETPSTASFGPKDLLRLSTLITAPLDIPQTCALAPKFLPRRNRILAQSRPDMNQSALAYSGICAFKPCSVAV